MALNAHDRCVPPTGKSGWHKVEEYGDFVKWQYSDGPYRVIVHKNDRGHYEARFTSWFNPDSYLIRGNCGGDEYGRLKAVLAAQEWMEENAYGCPPPGQYK